MSQSQRLRRLEDELQVVVDPEKLAARRLTLTRRPQRAPRPERRHLGRRFLGRQAPLGRPRAWASSARREQVENQLLAIRDGAPVFVRDVAEVRLGYKKPDGIVRRFGESSIAINATRETGANVLDVMDGLQAGDGRAQRAKCSNPRGLQLTQVYDETEYIYSAIDLVKDNIFVGGALTMVVLMLFLHLEDKTLLVIPLIMVTAVVASYISPWFFVVCLALILVVRLLVCPRRAGRRAWRFRSASSARS